MHSFAKQLIFLKGMLNSLFIVELYYGYIKISLYNLAISN